MPERPSVWIIFAVTVTGITNNTLIAPSLPDILLGVGAPRSAAGFLIGAATLPGIALAPIIGLLADRHGRREVLVPCLAIFGIAGGLGALAPGFWTLVGLRFLQGFGSAGLVNLAVVIIGDHWDGIERARMIGRNSAVLTASLAVFPTIGGVLTDVWGWRAPFLLYPLALLTAWLLLRRLPPTPTRQVGLWRLFREALPFLKSRQVLGLLAAGATVFALIFGLVLTVLPLYAESRFGLGASWRGVLLGLPAVATTVVALNLGRLTARLGHRRMVAAAAAVLTAALLLVAGAPALPVLVLGILSFGIGEGMMIPTLQDLATGAAPASSRGAVVATFVSAARVGQTVGPVAAGASLGSFGAPATFAAGAVVAGAMAAGIALRPGRTAPRGRPADG